MKPLLVYLCYMVSLVSTTGFLPLRRYQKYVSSTSRSPSCRTAHYPSDTLVALTREASKNHELGHILSKKGIHTVALPCISHDAGHDRELLPNFLLKPWNYVVITSPHAASCLLDAWSEAGYPSLQIASIGSRTSSILIDGGITPVFEASCANADTLAKELPYIPNLPNPLTVLYPTSSVAKDTLQAALKQRGFEVTRLNSYTSDLLRWGDSRMLEDAKRTTLITFGSPSAVKVKHVYKIALAYHIYTY